MASKCGHKIGVLLMRFNLCSFRERRKFRANVNHTGLEDYLSLVQKCHTLQLKKRLLVCNRGMQRVWTSSGDQVYERV